LRITVYSTIKKIILASGSPRRRDYLQQLGIDFTIQLPQIIEKKYPGELPEDFVSRMASKKGNIVARRCPDAWVISADTIVCLDNELLGKPDSAEHAVTTLMRLSAKEHRVITAFCVICSSKNVSIAESVVTRVVFTDFSEQLARAYVATGESFDKAGGYGIQGRGAILVREIKGSYTNVVGLPLSELVDVLERVSAIELQLQN
jgi:septum formation protein